MILTFRSNPYLAGYSRRDLGRAWRRALPKTFSHWQPWLGVILNVGCVTLAVTASALIGGAGVSLSDLTIICLQLLVLVLGIVIGNIIFRALSYGIATFYMGLELGVE